MRSTRERVHGESRELGAGVLGAAIYAGSSADYAVLVRVLEAVLLFMEARLRRLVVRIGVGGGGVREAAPEPAHSRAGIVLRRR